MGDSDSSRTKSEQRLEKSSHKSRSEGDSSDTEDSDYKPSDDDDDKMEESSSGEENSEGQEIDAMEVEDLEKDTANHRTKESITNNQTIVVETRGPSNTSPDPPAVYQPSGEQNL
ncbi:hypothetical protein G6F62_011819 [Rhizopus arrhizus]|nr:hypothetical protein G6F62_011819 [Rhizopus arrhizus]